MEAYSMTGFGRGEGKGRNFEVIVEIKSVNHRFKDFRFKMPSAFFSQEMALRDKINQNFKRGSFEILINLKKLEEQSISFGLDLKKIDSYLTAILPAMKRHGLTAQARPVDFLRNEFLESDEDVSREEWPDLLFSAFDSAVEMLKKSRKMEGEKLVGIIGQHLQVFRQNYQVVLDNVKTLQQEIGDRLVKKLQSLSQDLEIDKNRLNQEIVFYMDKLDVEEEVNRIRVHLEKYASLMEKGGELGKNMDFLIQELNRETHTIGAKTNCVAISEATIQMKVQLEKIREQTLNLE